MYGFDQVLNCVKKNGDLVRMTSYTSYFAAPSLFYLFLLSSEFALCHTSALCIKIGLYTNSAL